MRDGAFVRIDRVYEDPRPGRTRRVRVPKFMQTLRRMQKFTDDGEGFYGWRYERPMSWTSILLSCLAAFAIVLMCLFPLAPIWMKKMVLYACLSILGLFFVVFVVRTVVFAVVWLLTGRHFWILPNITSDEIPIDEVFSPMWEFDDLDAAGNVVGRIGAVKRIGLAGALTAVLVGLCRSPRRTPRLSTYTKRTTPSWTSSTSTTFPRASPDPSGKWTRRIRRTSPRWTGCEGRDGSGGGAAQARRREENRTSQRGSRKRHRDADAAEPPVEPS